ncbi:retrovirus-related pol polyprotein from transposon TNT 1-94 [Tanacetum coccineum]|uniref:Retrovirus-related pol polyprotein from transposon TNT 1-94 n=1 Tax=Tanacetum coccineum TaxID=301880 RepID=A0ABQ5HNJ9_9ASTR
MPKIRKEDVSTSISPTIDIVSRITNVLKISNSLGSNLSNVPSSSNSLADCTVHFGNDQFAPILGYGDLNQEMSDQTGLILAEVPSIINLFSRLVNSVMQVLEVAFRKSTCFVRDLQGNDLLTGNRGSDLYIISLQENNFINSDLFMLNFHQLKHGLPKLKYVKDQLCSSCEMSKAKRSSFKSKAVPSSKGRLNLLHMDLCGPMELQDETPEVLKDFLTMIQRNLQAQVISVRTDRGTEFLNKTLYAYFKEEGIEHQTSTPRTPEQNDVVERRNRTLVEAARTMLSASKLPLSFWAEAVATAWQILKHINHHTLTHGNDKSRLGNLDIDEEKGDPECHGEDNYYTDRSDIVFYNKRTRLKVESIHIKFDEIKE